MQQYGLTIQSPQQLSYIESLTPDEATAAIKNPENQGTNPFPNKKGGRILQYAAGGMPTSSEMAPWFTRREASDQVHISGLFGGNAPGRADTLPRDVPVDSHVIPADVVASIGQGNTLSGGNILTGMFHSNPYGISSGRGRGTPELRLPAAPRPANTGENLPLPKLDSRGGRQQDHGAKTVPIAASSGEFLVHPTGVYTRGLQAAKSLKLDPRKLTPRKVMDLGHDVIDAMIVHVRKKEIEDARKRPGPRKD